jgi:translation initiation factor IF-1
MKLEDHTNYNISVIDNIIRLSIPSNALIPYSNLRSSRKGVIKSINVHKIEKIGGIIQIYIWIVYSDFIEFVIWFMDGSVNEVIGNTLMSLNCKDLGDFMKIQVLIIK